MRVHFIIRKDDFSQHKGVVIVWDGTDWTKVSWFFLHRTPDSFLPHQILPFFCRGIRTSVSFCERLHRQIFHELEVIIRNSRKKPKVGKGKCEVRISCKYNITHITWWLFIALVLRVKGDSPPETAEQNREAQENRIHDGVFQRLTNDKATGE